MTNKEKLTAAEAALHDLLIGAAVRVYVDQNGERIEYTTANRAKLYQYIDELKMLITPPTAMGPMRIYL